MKKCMFYEAPCETKPKPYRDTATCIIKWLKFKRETIQNGDMDVKQLEFSITAWECVNLYNCLAVSNNSE